MKERSAFLKINANIMMCNYNIFRCSLQLKNRKFINNFNENLYVFFT